MKVDYPWLQNPYYENENQRFSKREFLKTIDGILNQRQYFKITLLDWNEKAIKDIQGEIVSGTMTKTGSSAVRRTCNMNCSVSRGEYNPSVMGSDFSINKKIFLEIGIKNETGQYTEYPILWFPQGIFFISTFSIASATSSSINISLGLKDKMAMLDGSVGGRFPATVQLDTMTTQTVSGNIVEKKVKINDLIIELVNHFGGEQIPNIVVEDVPDKIRKYIRWMNEDEPLYIFYDSDNNTYFVTTDQEEKQHGVLKRTCEYGEDIGFVYDDFVYDSELTVAANSTITAALDSIKNYLGNFEYFYDEFGIFHFREIKNYLNNSKSTLSLNEMDEHDYLMETASMGKSVYTFSDNSNLISITNTPQYENIRNDIIVLGNKKSTDTNLTHEVRYHVAIDKKPEINRKGYKNILVYEDPHTKNYTLTIPTIVEKNLPAFGEMDIVYGILEGEEVIELSAPYTQEELANLADERKLGSVLNDKNKLNLFDETNGELTTQDKQKKLLNRLVFLSEIFIDLAIDKGALENSLETIEENIQKYTTDILNNGYYLDILNSELENNSLDERIVTQAQLLNMICIDSSESVANIFTICNNIIQNIPLFGNNIEENDNQYTAIIKSLTNQIETCGLLIQNYENDNENGKYNSQIFSLNEEIKDLKLQIAWYKSRERIQNIVDNGSKSDDYPIKKLSFKVKRAKFWYWDNEWLPLNWTRYYSKKDDMVYINQDYSYQTLGNYNESSVVQIDKLSFDMNGKKSYIAEDWRTEIILQGLQAKYTGTDNNSYYYEELIGNWPTIYNLDEQKWANESDDKNKNYKSLCDGYFFLDIIDVSSNIYGEYSVSNIGRRQIVDVSNDINCLFEPQTLPIGFLLMKDITKDNYDNKKQYDEAVETLNKTIRQNGLSVVNIPAESTHLTDYFAVGGIFNDAFTKVKYNLLTHTNYQNTISLSAIPAWYLEPNVVVSISDYSTNTFGNYLVQSISYTFGAGNPMTVNCSKTVERVI